MGNTISNQISQRITRHRALSLAICDTTYMDPRHLEHFNYIYWTSELAGVIFHKDLTGCLIAPQFPVWVSQKEVQDPDTSFVSTFSSGDSTARGVYVDIAIVLPIVQPRALEELKSHASELANHTLLTFLSSFIHREIVASRCLWAEELVAPILLELKPGPTRHPKNFERFYKNLTNLLRAGQRQALEQTKCLFCSWRFASQDTVYALAGAGDFWRVRRLTRSWALKAQIGPWTPNRLERSKGLGSEDYTDGLEDLEDEDDREDWTEGLEDKLYGLPGDAMQRKIELAAQREQRRNRRAQHRERYLRNLEVPPNYNDRGLPLFDDGVLDRHHRSTGEGDFFQTLSANIFFQGNRNTSWTRVMRLGSARSNDFMAFLSSKLKEIERLELGRYGNVPFTYKKKQKA